MVSSILRRLSKKRLVGLVYVGISLLLVSWAAEMTQAQVQWFASADKLQPSVESVVLSFDPNSPTGFAFVNATLSNPSDYGGVRVSTVYYTVFVNSTTQGFSVQDSSEVAISVATYKETVPARGSISIAYSMELMPDVVLKLNNFTATHHDQRDFVLIVVNLESTYGTLALQYCFETPNRILPTCPDPRASARGRGAGG